MPTEVGRTVLQVTTPLLLVLATVAVVHGMWFLLVLAVGALLTSSFYTAAMSTSVSVTAGTRGMATTWTELSSAL
jgi:hypothetical protein